MWYLLIKVLFRFNYFWRPYSSFKPFIFKFFNNFLQKNEKSSCSVLLINTNIRCLNQAGTVSWSVWCESGHVCDTGSHPVRCISDWSAFMSSEKPTPRLRLAEMHSQRPPNLLWPQWPSIKSHDWCSVFVLRCRSEP